MLLRLAKDDSGASIGHPALGHLHSTVAYLPSFGRPANQVCGYAHTGGKGTLTQWVHCEFVVSFEAIHPVITQQVCGEFF